MSKICIFSAQFLPHLGGVERYTYNLATFLNKLGDEVVVITSNTQNLRVYEKMDNIEVYRLPCFDLLNGRYPVMKYNSVFFKVHKRLMRENFDLVLINTRFYLHSVYGTIFAKKQKTKCIMIEHGTSHMTLHNPLADFVERIIEHGLTIIDKINCKEFYGVSRACGEWLKHFGIESCGELYNAVDLNNIESIKQRPVVNYRDVYKISSDSVVIGFTGRLLKEKGILQLTDAVRELQEEEKKVVLWIAGDGAEEKELREKTNDRIILMGRLKFEEIIAMLQQTDIFCLPSDSEGFSTSILEAIACKCYVITTARGGSKEMILDKSYGMIMETNDKEMVKKAIKDVLNKKEYREAATEKAYQRLKEKFTWEIVSQNVHDLAVGEMIQGKEEEHSEEE